MASAPGASPEQRELLADMEKKATAQSAEMAEAAAEAEPDAVNARHLMQRLAHMNVVQRLTLALKGGRTERMTLIRDPNKLVQRCVLQSPRLTDTEVEAFASMTNLTGEILRAISMSRVFMKNYSIVRNLTNNPKTPLDVSLHLFPRLTATDLVKLTANKNVPETLRSSAQKLHRKRKMGVPGNSRLDSVFISCSGAACWARLADQHCAIQRRRRFCALPPACSKVNPSGVLPDFQPMATARPSDRRFRRDHPAGR